MLADHGSTPFCLSVWSDFVRVLYTHVDVRIAPESPCCADSEGVRCSDTEYVCAECFHEEDIV